MVLNCNGCRLPDGEIGCPISSLIISIFPSGVGNKVESEGNVDGRGASLATEFAEGTGIA